MAKKGEDSDGCLYGVGRSYAVRRGTMTAFARILTLGKTKRGNSVLRWKLWGRSEWTGKKPAAVEENTREERGGGMQTKILWVWGNVQGGSGCSFRAG